MPKRRSSCQGRVVTVGEGWAGCGGVTATAGGGDASSVAVVKLAGRLENLGRKLPASGAFAICAVVEEEDAGLSIARGIVAGIHQYR